MSVLDDSGERHRIRSMGPGDLFGVVALMTGNKAMADVIGKAPSQALLIPQAVFSGVITRNVSAIAHLSKLLVERMQKAHQEGRGPERALAALQRSDDPYGLGLHTDRPIKILVINCGSSSLKYRLFDTNDDAIYAAGQVERIGLDGTMHRYDSSLGSWDVPLPRADHTAAFDSVMEALTSREVGLISSPDEVGVVGHRVVHGGPRYGHSVLITEEVLEEIERLSAFAPLHNPVNAAGIKACARLFPGTPQVAVFDTGFHQTMPPYAYLYGLPYDYYEEKGIRRYGFHGASHKYVSLKSAEFLRRPYNELSSIICHLGNGASVCAVDHGRSIDTSMGFTPAEGLLMGTRCGDLDPAILTHLIRSEGMGIDDLNRLINQEGGLKGISGVSSDMRQVEQAAEEGNYRALVAIRTFCYRIRKYIGAYAAAMGQMDVVAFTGGIGEKSVGVRSMVCQGLDRMGITIDEEKNRRVNGSRTVHDIGADDSAVRILVIQTDEERLIARDCLRVLERDQVSSIMRQQKPMAVPVEVSAHHLHLSDEHLEALFGPGHQLTPMADLSQPGQYACEERVNLIGPKGRINNVRVLGPTRKETQIEIAMTEQFRLGIDSPIRESGDLDGTPGIALEGPFGEIHLVKGVICALRHIHMPPEDALRMGLKDKDMVQVRVPGNREITYGDVLVRVSPNYRLAFHIDTDEANAANIANGAMGFVDGIQSRR